jgi:hypothetical protein
LAVASQRPSPEAATDTGVRHTIRSAAAVGSAPRPAVIGKIAITKRRGIDTEPPIVD